MNKVQYCKCPICGKVYEEEENQVITLPKKNNGTYDNLEFDVCPKCGKKWRKALNNVFDKIPDEGNHTNGWLFNVSNFSPKAITGEIEIEGEKVE